MSATEQLKRLIFLIRLLQEADMRSARELADACGVSRRTIFRDLERLEDLGIRVESTEGGYRLRNHLDVDELFYA